MGAPTFGNILDGSVNGSLACSVSLTITTGNLLVAMIGVGASNPVATRTPTTVVFGGSTSLTHLVSFDADDGNFERVELWYYPNPPAGSLTVTVTGDGVHTIQCGLGLFELIGVDLGGIFGTPSVVNNNVSGSTIATAAQSPSLDQIVLLALATDDDTGGTIDNGGSQIWEELSVNTDSAMEGAYYTGGSTVTPQWSALASVGGAVAAVIVNGTASVPSLPTVAFPTGFAPSYQQRMG